MREILFRGKRTDNGEWVEGYLVKHTLNHITEWWEIHTGQTFSNGERERYRVDPETVGQYTGLTDKNGQRIFEGDIIKTHYANAKNTEFVERVVFHNGRFCGLQEQILGQEISRWWAGLPDGVPHLPQDKMVYMDWCVVIGNIHDNPELLKGGEG